MQGKIYREYADEHSKAVKDMISQIEKDGDFKVRSSDTARCINKGETMVKSSLLSGFVSPIAGMIYTSKAMEFKEGTDYKVNRKINEKYMNPDGTLNANGENELQKVEKKLNNINEKTQKRYDRFKNSKLNSGILVVESESKYDRVKDSAVEKLGDNLKSNKLDPLTLDDYFKIAKRTGVSKKQIEEWKNKLDEANIKQVTKKRTEDFVKEAARQSSIAAVEQQRIQQQIQIQMQAQMQQQIQMQIQQQIQQELFMQQQLINQQMMTM